MKTLGPEEILFEGTIERTPESQGEHYYLSKIPELDAWAQGRNIDEVIQMTENWLKTFIPLIYTTIELTYLDNENKIHFQLYCGGYSKDVQELVSKRKK